MLRVGLTGGVACGKSTVARMFGARGAHVLDADLVVRELMMPGGPVYHEVVRTFGSGILKSDGSGSIDRARLAGASFAGGKIKLLNAIVHPAVMRQQQQWMNNAEKLDPRGIAVVEAALIVEAGALKQFDKLVVVVCHPEHKIERYAARAKKLGLGNDDDAVRDEARLRVAAQMTDEEKSRGADYVLDNAGTVDELANQFDLMFAELSRMAAAGGKSHKESVEPSS